ARRAEDCRRRQEQGQSEACSVHAVLHRSRLVQSGQALAKSFDTGRVRFGGTRQKCQRIGTPRKHENTKTILLESFRALVFSWSHMLSRQARPANSRVSE